MIDRILHTSEKKLIGISLSMSFAEDRTFELWRNFMPRRKEVIHTLNEDLISMQVFPPLFDFRNPDFNTVFEKRAAIEVSGFAVVPKGMETFVIPAGNYAIFNYRGDAGNAAAFFANIFRKWLPEAGYGVDNRPHYEILGTKYKFNSPDSEEEIRIPVRQINNQG